MTKATCTWPTMVPCRALMWEAVREGIKDYRYVSLLARSIAAAKASERAGARQAAAEADRLLGGLLGQIGWGFQALEGHRPHSAAPPLDASQMALASCPANHQTSAAVGPRRGDCPLWHNG